MKRVAIYIFNEVLNKDCFEDALEYSGICLCDYLEDEKIESCEKCAECEDTCLLVYHIDDKDVQKHIKLNYKDVGFPCVVCWANAYYKDERLTICPISEAKNNTKYGIVE